MPYPVLQLAGKRFGYLTVVAREVNNNRQSSVWRCVCDCGNVRSIVGSYLQLKPLISCGCKGDRRIRARRRPSSSKQTHGHCSLTFQSRTYHSWAMAKTRCFNKKHTVYEYYGGRGITMCERWKNSFVAFLADMGERPLGLSLDRINNNGNYEPGNCKWSTRSEQGLNRRSHKLSLLEKTT